MAPRVLLPLLAALRLCGGKLAAVRRHSSAEGEWTAAAEAEADDRRFWESQRAGMEAELLQLQAAVGPSEKRPRNAAFMQFTNGTSQVDPSAKRHSPLTGIKINLNPKSKADLVPALAMLKSLYEDGKQRISQLNAREQEYKQRYAAKESEHKAKVAHIAAQNGTVSDEFRANETRDEDRLWSYWQRVRERQHHQFHTSLKIQHGTLDKIKKMMDMYEKTIAGKEDAAQAQKDLARVTGGALPEVVLLQGAWRDTVAYCAEALKELQRAGEELDADGPGMEP